MTEIKICIGSSCHLKGAYDVIQTLQGLVKEQGLEDHVDMKAQFCMKQCQNGVAVTVDDKVFSVSPETAGLFFQDTVLPRLG